MPDKRWTRDLQRLAAWIQKNPGPHAGVFDIGTRAARLLVGPVAVPEVPWRKDSFYNTAVLTNLGAEVDPYERRMNPQGHAFRTMVSFMRDFGHLLAHFGVREGELDAVGTAVFRWLENRDEIIDQLERETGIRLKVIDDRDEARLSLASVAFTHAFGDNKQELPCISSGDAILLLDQGGGSMEVSYVVAGDFESSDVHSFDMLGTIALRERFFNLGPKGSKVDPELNQNRISTQNRRIQAYIEGELERWPGYPDIAGKRIHAYGMGSALTKAMARRVNNFNAHNRVAQVSNMNRFVEEHCAVLDQSNQQVRTVYKVLSRDRQDKRAVDLANLMVTLYGLPVYASVLERFGVEELRICGYGLRYGAYLWRHHWEAEL